MNIFQRIDDWIPCVFFTAIAHWFQHRTGKDNFFVAKACSIVMLISLMMIAIDFRKDWINLEPIDKISSIVFVLFFGLDGIQCLASRGVRFFLNLMNSFGRLLLTAIGICFSLFILALVIRFGIWHYWIHAFFSLFAVMFMPAWLASNYFDVVTPLPPRNLTILEKS